ncbi:MAG: acyl-CoA dehydrogenase family protein [Acidimicrobiales bacterium]
MNFVVSEDEAALAEGIRALCAGRFSMEKLRSTEGSPTNLAASDWRELGDAGVFSIRMAEDLGGLGLGMVESVVVFEELGKALVPGPLVAAALGAGLIDGASDGSAIVGSIARPPHGTTSLIGHLGALDSLIVVDDDGLSVVDPAEVLSSGAAPAERSLDPLTPMWIVRSSLPEGERIGGPEAAIGWRYGQALLSSALCVGIAAQTLGMAVEYARSREQFGRPIGSFQAVKHICADMLVRVELARVALHAAAVISDDPEVGDPIRTMAGASLLSTHAALENSRKCIQVHGGMGFTWEVPAHLYLMRSRVLEDACRAGADMAETVAERL